MKYIKLFEEYNNNNIEDIMSDEDNAIEYLKSIDFFDSHGYDKNDDYDFIYDNIGEICYIYRKMKSNHIVLYRAMSVPSFDDVDLTQVGYFYSFIKDGAGTYDAALRNDFNKKWKSKKEVELLLTVSTNVKNIDWLNSLLSNAIYGEEQFECYLFKGSDIEITHINGDKLDNPIKAIS